ncbi:two-component system NtrC family sensor kinase [Oxalobacteraceae bacterium GrIS 1.11]
MNIGNAGIRLLRSSGLIPALPLFGLCAALARSVFARRLEARVALRTRELIQSNAQLLEVNVRLSAAQAGQVQAEKMVSLGQLAAGVAHEINNPIGYIYSNFGSLEYYLGNLFELLSAYEATQAASATPHLHAALRERLGRDFLQDDTLALLRESKSGIVRIKGIVQDLRNFSRADSAQEWQSVDLHHGIDATLDTFHGDATARASVSKQYGDLPAVDCVPAQINQVLTHLLLNAVHATGAQGAGQIYLRTSVEGDAVVIEVSDNGAGIRQEDLRHIFDPFFTTKPVGEGAGLGLAVAYGIVQQHGGRIEVSSEAGAGATFRVRLPIRRAETGPIH